MINFLVCLILVEATFVFCLGSDALAVSFIYISNKNVREIRKSINSDTRECGFVHRENKKGRTPLFYAVKYGSYEDVQYLIDNEAELNIKDLGGKSIASLSIERMDDDLIKFLFMNGLEFKFLDPLLKQAIDNIRGKKRAKKILSTLSIIYVIKKIFLFDNQHISSSINSRNRELSSQTCVSCSDNVSLDRDISTEVALCQQCSNIYLNYALNNVGLEQISYPVTDVNSGLYKKEICPEFLLDLGADHLDFFRYLRGYITRKLNGKAKWKFCHGHDCLNGLEVENFKKGKCLDCDICGFKGCLNCGMVHASDDCETAVLAYSGIKSCPGCGTFYQKMSGCNLISCPSCYISWTWNDRVIRNSHYNDGAHITPYQYMSGNLEKIRKYGDVDGFFNARK
ncbi:MAG: ankyrin repeat domain-containing protein [Oligoflexales bacterium]